MVVKAAVLFAQQVRRRDPRIVEEQPGGVGGVLPDLREFRAALKSGVVRLDDQQAY